MSLYEKNIASVIAMLHHRLQLYMPTYAQASEFREITQAVGDALRSNADRNDELTAIRARIAELEAVTGLDDLASAVIEYRARIAELEAEVERLRDQMLQPRNLREQSLLIENGQLHTENARLREALEAIAANINAAGRPPQPWRDMIDSWYIIARRALEGA